MSLTRHTAYNLISTILPAGIALVTVPLYLATIGAERYGALSICWLLLGYLGALDLGLGRAMAQRIAAVPPDDTELTSRIFSTGLTLSAALALAAAITLYVAGEPLFRLIGFGARELSAEMTRTVPLLAATLPLTILSGALNGALMGRERFAMIAAVELVSSVALSVGPLLTARLIGPELPALVATALAIRLAALPVLLVGCRRALQIGPRRPDRAIAGQLLGFGGWVSVSGLVSPILSLWDRFAIGAALGAAAVAAYVVPANLLQRLTMLPDALARALFPRLARMGTKDRSDLTRDALSALSALMTPVAIALAALADPLLVLWVGPTFATASAPVAEILAFGLWTNSFAFIAYATLHASGRPRAAALNHLAEILPYLGLLWLLIRQFGIAGAAIAWSARTTLDLLLMARATDEGVAPLARIVLPGALVIAACAAATLLSVHSAIRWVLHAALIGGALWHGWTTMPPSLRGMIGSVFARARTFRHSG